MVNWPLAIARNRDALSRIADMLLAMAGLGDGSHLSPPLRGRK